MKNEKRHKSAKPFFQKIFKNKEIRIHYEEEKSKTEIAHAIKHVRTAANLTQLELAKLIGTSQSVIARLEGGSDQRIPTLPLLARIAAACGAHLEFGFSFAKAS